MLPLAGIEAISSRRADRPGRVSKAGRLAGQGPVAGSILDAVPELTIVMPYYNPGDRLGRNVSDVVAVLERHEPRLRGHRGLRRFDRRQRRRASKRPGSRACPADRARPAQGQRRGSAGRADRGPRATTWASSTPTATCRRTFSDRSSRRFAQATSTSCSAASATPVPRWSTRW